MKKLVNVLLSITILFAFAACKLGTGAYDVEDPKTPAGQSGSSGNNPPASITYTPGKNGGLEGTSSQKPGDVVKENWMETNGNLKINGVEIPNTSEVVVIPSGTVAKITMTTEDGLGYVFTSSRKVKLSPFVMSQYPVTRGLYTALIGNDPSLASATGTESENPVNYINWFEAIVFCNKLSLRCGLKPVYSYDFSTDGSGKMTNPDDWFKDTTNLSATVPNASSSTNLANWRDKVAIDLTANGYRLPTNTEWEFAARGGDPNVADWAYTYSGSNTLDEVGWSRSSYEKTNVVGGMQKGNRLGIYDMSGNVFEWCDDFYNDSVTIDDVSYTDSEGYVNNPIVVTKDANQLYRTRRGGCFSSGNSACKVKELSSNSPLERQKTSGLRVCRSVK